MIPQRGKSSRSGFGEKLALAEVDIQSSIDAAAVRAVSENPLNFLRVLVAPPCATYDELLRIVSFYETTTVVSRSGSVFR